jgi:fibronectin-binding autotransporter adhesin
MIEKKLFVSGLFVLALAAATHGGTFAEQFLTASPAAAADLSSGISPSKTYTHLVDWGSDDGGAVVNGVTLIPDVGGAGSNFTLTGTNNIFQNNPSNNYDTTSGMFDLNDDFLFTGSIPPAQTLTLTGLTGGRTYIISHYLSNGWNGAQQVLDGDDDGFGFNTLTTDRGDASGPKVIRYTYTQAPGDTDFQMTFTAVNSVDGFHHYAFTNELVIPEPLSLGLLGAGALGLLSRRRRA